MRIKTRRVASGPMGQLSVSRIFLFALCYVTIAFLPFLTAYFMWPADTWRRSLCSSFSGVSVVFKLLVSMGWYVALLLASVQALRRVRFPLGTFFKQKLTGQDRKWLALCPVFVGACFFCLFPQILLAEDPGVFLNAAWGKWMISCCDWRVWALHNVSYGLSALVMVPVVEELFFRGILIHRLSVKYGAPAGVILAALIFGLLSGFDLGMVLMGLVLGWVYVYTGSLWLVILLHGICQMLVFGVDLLIAYGFLDFRQPTTFGLFWLVSGACFFAVLVGLSKQRQVFRQYPPFIKSYAESASGK